jgi:hypothetical protein
VPTVALLSHTPENLLLISAHTNPFKPKPGRNDGHGVVANQSAADRDAVCSLSTVDESQGALPI